MSARYSVLGIIKPTDEKFRKMYAVYKSCTDAGIPIPIEVETYFGESEPSEEGLIVKINDAISKPSKEYCYVYDVDLTKLPKGVSTVRFEVSF